LTKNEKDELFESSIQAYFQYPEELKQKGKKIAMKIISHAWRSYKSKLVKIWRNQVSYQILQAKPCTHHMHDPGSNVPHIRPKVFTDNQIS
jgi:hypothetical protein